MPSNTSRYQPKVLLLCDRAQEAARWAQALASRQVEVLQAASADEGYQLWAAQVPDVVAIDLGNDEGIEACRRLRPEAAIPMLVLLEKPDEAAPRALPPSCSPPRPSPGCAAPGPCRSKRSTRCRPPFGWG